MAISIRILRMSGKLLGLIMLLIISVSAWSLMHYLGPRIIDFSEQAIKRYDTMFPEITINNGTASVQVDQPVHVNTGDPEVIVVVDTRPEKESAFMEYLQKAKVGAVLTRTSVVIKNDERIQMVPLKDFPNMVINSKTLRELVDRYQDNVLDGLKVLAFLYFLFMKPIQLFLMTFMAGIVGRILSIPLTLGRTVKLSIIAMIPPVMLDVMYAVLERAPAASLFSYVGIYLLSMAILLVDLKQHPEVPPDTATLDI